MLSVDLTDRHGDFPISLVVPFWEIGRSSFSRLGRRKKLSTPEMFINLSVIMMNGLLFARVWLT